MHKIILLSLVVISSIVAATPVDAFQNLNNTEKNIHISVTKDDPAHWGMSGAHPDTRSITIESLSKRNFNTALSGVFENLRSVGIHSYHTNLDVDITGQLPILEDATIESTSGNIKANIGKLINPGATFLITATSGNIRLHIAPDSNVKVKVATKSGSIESSSLVHKSGFWNTREYVTQHFDPGTPYLTIEVKTTSGDVKVD